MTDNFDGLGWREYMRGIENGNIDPTGERLRAVCRLARENHETLIDALKLFADPASWRLSGSCDPNSGAFRGLQTAQGIISRVEGRLP